MWARKNLRKIQFKHGCEKKTYLGVLYSSFFMLLLYGWGFLFVHFLDFNVNHCLRRENASKIVCFP